MPFDPKTIELEDSNLIEASAGTGKTYSIAIMALRLVVEKDIKINQILMVTFTKAAVAELEMRVRAFLRLGLKVVRGEQISDSMIRDIVQEAIENNDIDTIKKRLEEAVLFLDETAVLTIHSFCQKVLKEFSFETNQIFGAEAISPDEFNQLVEDSFNEYWRKKITTLNTKLLTDLLEKGFTRDAILQVVKDGLSGKLPTAPVDVPADFLTPTFQDALLRSEGDEQQKREEIKQHLLVQLNNWGDDLPDMIKRGGKHATDAFSHLVSPEFRVSLLNAIMDRAGKNYIPKAFTPEFAEAVVAFSSSNALSKKDANILMAQIGVDAFRQVANEVSRAKEDRGHITFDDMILSVKHALAIEENRIKLIQYLNEKFKAVFIDEFQDTDKDQYVIFNTLFGETSILFYIGDPKQSIYGWRKADMSTYFKAKDEVRVPPHSMNVNHRSNEAFIQAMNEFFQPTAGFDTFFYNGVANGITYIPVESPAQNTKGSLLREGEPPIPLLISEHEDKFDLKKGIKHLIQHILFSNQYTIAKKGEAPRAIKPSDLGILVRSNAEAVTVKKILITLGVPGVTINDTKLFESEEAVDLYYIMMAVHKCDKNSINRALLTHFGGYNPESFAKADKDAIAERFKTYQETWKKEGVYVMLRQFLSDHNLSDKFYDTSIENPERLVANVLQLVEIIHKISERKNYDQLEQIQWLKKGIDGEWREGDEYEQRLERDEEAVKIVTIHKAKGLEYNIVIAPFLDLRSSLPKSKTISFRHPDTGDYLVVSKDLATTDEQTWYRTQTEQENRRLLYVAITRARYQCFVLGNMGKSYANSSLRSFTNAIKGAKNVDPDALPHIGLWDIPFTGNRARAQQVPPANREYAVAKNFTLTEKYWRKASFTALSPEHQSIPLPKYQGVSDEAYDRFIFRDLKKGAQTGNLLHYIFEHIDFTNSDYWPATIEKAVRRLAANTSPEFLANLNAFLHQVIDTELPTHPRFTLNQISNLERLTELEFDFPLQQINMREIENLSTSDAPLFVRNNDEMEGIMTGKIDLFFRYNGKYYILDWKSNYLGETAEDYSKENMQEAMNENNYHLQYHIYSVAANKYLANRIPDWDYDQGFGGVIYLFVRGVRNGSDTGIYLARPEKDHVEKLSQLLSGKL